MVMTTVGGLTMPITIREQLILEVGNICPMPRCNNEVWDLFPIDNNFKDIRPENLLPLCSSHYIMAKTKKLSQQMLHAIRNLLSKPSSEGPEFQILHSRDELLHILVENVKNYVEGEELRLNYVGPLVLHPSWYHDRRDEKEGSIPNMERPLWEVLKKNIGKRYSNIKFQFRNVPRYLDKLNEIVRPHERKKFIQDTLENIHIIWGEDGGSGPDVICLETGFFRHPFIFHNVVVEATRAAPHMPTQSGIVHKDSNYVKWEKENFDHIFSSSSRGHQTEVQSLVDFVAKLWGG